MSRFRLKSWLVGQFATAGVDGAIKALEAAASHLDRHPEPDPAKFLRDVATRLREGADQ